MNISNFYKSIQITDKYSVIFNNLVFKMVLVNDDFKQKILNNLVESNEIREKLITYGIYSNEIDDQNRINELVKQYENRSKEIKTIYIIPTSTCNLTCNYCHVYQNSLKYKPSHMCKKIAEKTISRIVEYYKKNNEIRPFIQFYGGEPTLNWPIIDLITSKLKNEIGQVDISIITNGTIGLKDKVGFLLKNDVGVGISLDGPEELNNINRMGGSNYSYKEIIENIQILQDNKIRTAISLTVTEEVIDNSQIVIKWIKKLGIDSVNLNFLQCMPWSDNKKNRYADEATDFLIKLHSELPNLSNDRLNRKVSYFLEGECIFSDCAAGYGNQITVNPNGNLGICQGEFLNKDRFIGNIYADDMFKIQKEINNRSHRFIYNNTIYNPKCINCESLYICGGGCESKRKDIDIDLVFCEHTKKISDWILKKLIDINDYELKDSIYLIN